jgi:hypothetical protein
MILCKPGEGMQKRLIQDYGLFWARNKVFWGRQENPGHLKGVPAGGRGQDPVDFRTQQGVYVLYDENFRLVYVGQAGSRTSQRLFARLKHHRKDKLADRWIRFSWFGTRGVLGSHKLSMEPKRISVTPNVILDQIEAILISSTEPPLNLQGGRFGKGVKRYLQYRSTNEVGLDSETMIRDIWDNLPQ